MAGPPLSSPFLCPLSVHRGSWPTITSTSGAGQSTSTGRSPAAGEAPFLVIILSPAPVPGLLLLTFSFPSGRGPGVALPAGVWPCFVQSLCTVEQQTRFSTGSRSCPVRSPGRKLGCGRPAGVKDTHQGPWTVHLDAEQLCLWGLVLFALCLLWGKAL